MRPYRAIARALIRRHERGPAARVDDVQSVLDEFMAQIEAQKAQGRPGSLAASLSFEGVAAKGRHSCMVTQ